MADISAEIAAFRNAVYGEDVRDAMVSLATKMNERSINTIDLVDEAVTESKIDIESLKKVFVYRGTDPSVQNLKDLNEMGLYSFTTNNVPQGRPDDADNTTSYMLVLHPVYTGNRFYTQIYFDIMGRIWYRVISSSDTIISWREISTDVEPLPTSLLYNKNSTANSITNLSDLNEAGYYSNNESASGANIVDGPSGVTLSIWTMLVLNPVHNSLKMQILIDDVGREVYFRYLNANNAVYSNWASLTKQYAFLYNFNNNSYLGLSQIVKPGNYAISSDMYDRIVSNINDFPTDAPRGIYMLNVFLAYDGNFVIQHLYNYDNKIWARCIKISDYSVFKNWALVLDPSRLPIDNTIDVLYGKKLVTAGDSYTEAVFRDNIADYNGKNYGYYVAQRHNMAFVNSGISGSTMAITKAHIDDPDNVPENNKSPFSLQRYLNVPADTDYLTIWFGINDSAYCNLGTINDETNETFYGAWNIVLRYYLTNRPFLKLGIIVTPAANDASFAQAVRDVAKKWGYPYLDWVADDKVPAFFERDGMSNEAKTLRRAAYGWNGPVPGHPNPEWHKYAATIYENFLRSL